jgi:hypothetical protein
MPQDVGYQVVSRLLYYGALCRELADRPSCDRAHRAMLLAQAERWVRDADRVLTDQRMIAESLALLVRVSAASTMNRVAEQTF